MRLLTLKNTSSQCESVAKTSKEWKWWSEKEKKTQLNEKKSKKFSHKTCNCPVRSFWSHLVKIITMNFTKTFGSFRTFGSSAKRFSGTGEHPTDGSSFKMWRYATYFFCVPVVTATTYMNFGPNAEHGHRPTYVPYDYLRIRTKALNFKLIGCRPIFPILLPPSLPLCHLFTM